MISFTPIAIPTKMVKILNHFCRNFYKNGIDQMSYFCKKKERLISLLYKGSIYILYCSQDFVMYNEIGYTVITYVGHFLGSMYPSRPGFTAMLFTKFLQLRHWMEIRMALALIAEAEITIPGTFTNRDISLD